MLGRGSGGEKGKGRGRDGKLSRGGGARKIERLRSGGKEKNGEGQGEKGEGGGKERREEKELDNWDRVRGGEGRRKGGVRKRLKGEG